MKDVRFRLMAVAVMASIVVLGILAISQTISIGRLLVDQSLRRLEYRGALVASELNSWLENQIGYLNAAAEDTNWIMEYRDDDTLSNILQNHYQSSENNFFQVFFGYPDGTAWFSSGWEPNPNTWRADRQQWYTGAMIEPGAVFVSDPYRDEKSGSFCVAISKAILRGGELLVIVGADIYIESIQKLVNEVPVMDGRGFGFLLAEDTGIVLVHPNQDYMPGEDGRFKTVHEIGNMYEPLLNVPDGETIPIERADGTRRYYSSHSIPSAGWKLISTVNEQVILDPINEGVRIEIFLSLLVFLLICVLLFVTTRAMGRATRTAQEHSDMKTTFLANMSHEIRTPMNGIIGFAELALENTGITGQTREYLEKIRNSTKDLLAILNDILDISKIEAGKVTLEKIPFDLHDLFVTCENTIGLKAAEKGITLYVYSEPFIEYKLLGDPTKLRQILLNLLSNAIKFTNVGTVKLMVTAEQSLSDRVILRFEVKDSGVGMTAAQMKTIFEPFEQGDRGTTRKYGGTGLGLPITKNLVELMGGKLEVESAPGIGSKFSFTLKFDLSDRKAESPGKEQAAAEAIQRPVFAGRILVCEDNTMNQDVIRDHLQRIGLEVDIQGNGKLGVEAIQKSMEENRPYELILMDIHMPVMDGLEASAEIKRLGCMIPIIALTANVLTQDTDIYYRYGIVDHLGKPFTSQELWACLSKYLIPVATTSAPESEAVADEAPQAAAPGPQAAPDAPGIIDYRAGLEMTAGNQELYDKLRRDFYTHNKNFFEAFCALLGEGLGGETNIGGRTDENIVTAHRLVHTLKSSAALIGAEKLRAAAADIEAPLKTGAANYSPQQLANLQTALEATLKALEQESKA